MRAQEEFGRVVARVAFHFGHLHLGRGQRLAGLGFLRGVGRVAVHVVHDPVVEPALHVGALLERADLVAHDALEVVREAAAREHVGQARRQVGVGRGVRIVVFGRLVQRLGTDEGRDVGVLAVHQRHEAVLGQFGLAPVADGDLGRALHVHAAIVRREGVRRQVVHRAAGLHPADRGAPAVVLERTVDVHGHGIGGVGPCVLAVVAAGRFLLEVELVHRVRLGAVRQAREEARHREADVLRIVRVAQAAPRGVLGVGEDLGQVAGVGQLLPGVHLHHRGRRAGDERAVSSGGHLRHLAEQLHVRRAVVEIVVTHQAAERLAAELAVFLFVHLLEDGALVPAHALEAAHVPVQLLLGDVHHADLEQLVHLGVVDQVVQAAPCALELLEIAVVDDQVDLLGELAVDLGDDGLNGLVGVVGQRGRGGQGLLRQRLHGRFDRLARLVGLGLEFLLQQRGEFAAFERLGALHRVQRSRRVHAAVPFTERRRSSRSRRRRAGWASRPAT